MEKYQLKPALAEAIRQGNEALAAAHFTMTPSSRREVSLRGAFEQTLPKVPVADIVDAVLDGCGEYDVPVRIYRPAVDKPLPVIIFYHGGGFVIDSTMVYDPIMRRVAAATGHIVISPDYRLAPECPYPAAERDAEAVARRSLKKLDDLGIAYVPDLTLIGDSAGGYLAAVVCERLQGSPNVPITHQILVYPCLDMSLSYPSTRENGIDAYGSDIKRMEWYFDCYFQHGEDRRTVSPLFGAMTDKMPPTLMITTQFCPFRDEGMAYAERLKQLGVPVTSYNLTNVVHSYLNFEKLCFEEIQFTYEKMAEFLNGSK